MIEEQAKRKGWEIVAYFGGSYESAQTDGRKEFQRMLDLSESVEGSISQIMVYNTDRFSRTGAEP